jgi:prephenate dehydrogenase
MNTVIDMNIAIVGLGLMGGSLGLSLARSGFRVSGWDSDRRAQAEAFKIGAISRLTDSLQETVAGADLVFVATPVGWIAETIRSCLPLVKPGVIFSDLGSIKQMVVDQVSPFLPDACYFVPGHPMTGSEQQGIAAADPFLFQNAAYILVEHPRTPAEIRERVGKVLATTGAHLLTLGAADHDRIVGMVSHLPHLIAAVLAKTAGTEEEARPGTLNLAAGGFRDTTRVATGSPTLWEGIIAGNKQMVLLALDSFQRELAAARQFIAEDDPAGLTDFLRQARDVRLQIPAKNKGFLTLLHELVVTIEDRPGAIHEVLQDLADVGLNIKDIEILRVREGDGGTLRLALENEPDADRALVVLASKGIKAKRR